MGIFRPEIFDPDDAFSKPDYVMEDEFPLEEIDDERLAQLAAAPNFHGNYQEIDNLPEGETDELNSFITAIAEETASILQGIDFSTLRRSSEGEYVIEDLIVDIRENTYFIFESKRITAVASLLFQNNRFHQAEAILTFAGEDGARNPKYPNEVSPMVLLAMIAEKNGAWTDIAKFLMTQDGNARFPKHKACMRILILALNHMQKYEDAVRLTKQFAAEEGIEKLMSEVGFFQNYLIALNALGQHEKVLGLCMKNGELVLPRHCIQGALLGAIGHAFNCLGKQKEWCRVLEEFHPNAQCRNTPEYASSLSHALAACGRHKEVVSLLTDINGRRYRFPGNLTCMRNLGYAFINLGLVREAAQVLSWVERESPYNAKAFLGVRNALNRKIRETRHAS